MLKEHLGVKMKSKTVDFFEEISPFTIQDFDGWDVIVQSYELNSLKLLFAKDSLFILETEKQLGDFSYFGSVFCGIIEEFISNKDIKKAKNELTSAFNELGDSNSVSLVNLLSLKLRVLIAENKNPTETHSTIRKVLSIFDQNLPKDHLIYPIFYNLLAEIYLQSNDPQTSLTLFNSSLLAYSRILSPTSPILAAVHKKMAIIHSVMGSHENEIKELEHAIEIIEPNRLDHRHLIYELEYRLTTLYKSLGRKVDTVKHGLRCVEALEGDAYSYKWELISCYLMVIEGTITLGDYATARMIIDNCALLLSTLDERPYMEFGKLLGWALEVGIWEQDANHKEHTKQVIEYIEKSLREEWGDGTKDENWGRMKAGKAMLNLTKESSLYEKFSLMVPHHLEVLWNNREDIEGKTEEMKETMRFFENLLILNLNTVSN